MKTIEPYALLDYLKSKGWIVNEGAPADLYILTHPGFKNRQMIFPKEKGVCDRLESTQIVVQKIAAMENRSVDSVIRSILSLDWTDERLEELEILVKLVRECCSINSGNGIISRLQRIQELAVELENRDSVTERDSFLGFLQCLARIDRPKKLEV